MLAKLATLAALVGSTMASTLNITVINAHNNQSTLECWVIEPGFSQSTQPGTEKNSIQALGQATGEISYMMIPPRTDNGQHNAPTIQWVLFLAGEAHITLPHSDDEAWIHGGKNGAILALDTSDLSDGHLTDYPSGKATVGIEVPLEKVPEHSVLHNGGCLEEELV